MYILVQGYLKLKNGTKFGTDEDLFAGIITMTYDKEVMERLMKSGKLDSTSVILFDDLSPEEIIPDSEYTSGIKKEIKNFEGPKAFKNYLRTIKYKDFRFEK
jgi:hypothetical protein